MRIGGEEAVGSAIEVGEIAAAAAGYKDLFADTIGMVENEDAQSALASSNGGHESGCSRAEDEDVAGLRTREGWEGVQGHVGCIDYGDRAVRAATR